MGNEKTQGMQSVSGMPKARWFRCIVETFQFT
jgi:hypothetical protein